MHLAFALARKLAYDAAMTDNRDIDEILASLDALLREGDSHNDDMAIEAVSEGVVAESDGDVKGEVSEPVQNGVEAEPEDGIPRVVLTEDMMVENPQVRLPIDFAESAEPASEAETVDSQAESVQEDDRLEQKPQSSPAGDNDGEQAVEEQPIHLHKHEVERLLSLVSLDVSNHMQRLLPELIKDSLHKHLANMQHVSDKNNKTSDDE